jgi:hypothetical protein
MSSYCKPTGSSASSRSVGSGVRHAIARAGVFSNRALIPSSEWFLGHLAHARTYDGLFSSVWTAGSLVGATASGLLYAVEPGVPLLTEGILYLLVALTLTVVRAMAYLSSLVRIGHAVDLVSEESLE